MELLKNVVYYLANNMVIKDMDSQKYRLRVDRTGLWEIHPRMCIDARRIHECHVYFRWVLIAQMDVAQIHLTLGSVSMFPGSYVPLFV